MSSSLSGSGRKNQTLYDLGLIIKLETALIKAIRTHSEVLSVLERALAEKDSTVVSSKFVREVIDEAYKNLAYASNHLQNALDELDEFNKAI